MGKIHRLSDPQSLYRAVKTTIVDGEIVRQTTWNDTFGNEVLNLDNYLMEVQAEPENNGDRDHFANNMEVPGGTAPEKTMKFNKSNGPILNMKKYKQNQITVAIWHLILP